MATIPEIEHVISNLAPDLPVFDVKAMAQALNTLNGLMFFRMGAALAGMLGGLGLVLSVVGTYGVVSCSASQRKREIGIRLALGAQRADILWMILREGTVVVTSGLLFGLLLAYASSRLVGQFLVISPSDPLTYCCIPPVLALIALVACYVPARRSSGVDPMLTLRSE